MTGLHVFDRRIIFGTHVRKPVNFIQRGQSESHGTTGLSQQRTLSPTGKMSNQGRISLLGQVAWFFGVI